jgi:RimJ/RimL family protein N-acetyltransferase
MNFPSEYACLNKSKFTHKEFSLVPIRYEDRMNIMKWRNEQMYHLRQAELLTAERQEAYFRNNVAKLFEEERPNQLLFSFLKNGKSIGYGGLVHINWIDKNAEISFIMETELESNHFEEYWIAYLDLLEEMAFEEIKFNKLFTYAFDLRPNLYKMLEKKQYIREARLKEQCFFQGKFIDVVIHSKIKSNGY